MPTPAKFNGYNVTIAENQAPYLPLPARASGDENGTVITCWEFTEDELSELLKTRRLWFSHWTFNRPFQPLAPSVEQPAFEIAPPVQKFTLFGYPAEWMPNDKQPRNEKGETIIPNGYTTKGWYFWNLEHKEVFGPHANRNKCESAMGKYARDFEAEQHKAELAKHTQHIDQPDTDEQLADLQKQGFTYPGWYYWDETGANCCGPFDTRTKAIVALVRYVGTLR